MEFIDLKTQQNLIRESIEKRIKAVLDHGNYIMGPEIQELEKKLASFVGVKHCITCASGTDALLMALMARGIGPGDAVFTTPFTFIATAEVIALLGATPVFVDIDPVSYNMDPDKLRLTIERLKKGLTPASSISTSLVPKAIITVDLFGLPADYDQILSVAHDHGLFVLEDAAQSFGASYKGRKACSLTEIAATSFFPAKPLGCYGDGGAIFTNDDDLVKILGSIRVHGKGGDKYDNVRIGINGRLDTIQAAILLAKIEIFENEIQARQAVAQKYTDALKDIITTPVIPPYSISAWAQYTLRSEKRNAYMAKLKDTGIPTASYYPKPLHLQKAFSYLGYSEGDLPESEMAAREVFSLPMHPYLKSEEQEYIVYSIKGF